MSSAYDPGRTWREIVEQLSKAAPGSEAPEFLNALFSSMQQQFEVLQQAFEKQAAFQRDLAERALGPMKQMFTELPKAAETTRAAGEALQHAGDMLTQQAAAMNQALSLAQPFVETAFPPKPASAKQY